MIEIKYIIIKSISISVYYPTFNIIYILLNETNSLQNYIDNVKFSI